MISSPTIHEHNMYLYFFIYFYFLLFSEFFHQGFAVFKHSALCMFC